MSVLPVALYQQEIFFFFLAVLRGTWDRSSLSGAGKEHRAGGEETSEAQFSHL